MKKTNLIYNGFLLHPFKIKSIGIRDDYLFAGLLLPCKKSFGYSPSLTSLTSLRSFSSAPSHSCSKFKFKSLPRYHYHLVVTGKQVVNFVTLRDKLEKGLSSIAYENVKIRLVFGVVDLIPLDTFKERRNQGKHFGFIEIFSQLKKSFKEMFTAVSYEEEGLEFTFGSEAVDLLLKMINQVIESQGKDPEMIHIWMSFWLAEDDDGHNDDDDDSDDDELNDVDQDIYVSRYETRNLGSPSSFSLSPEENENKHHFSVSDFYFFSFSSWKEKQRDKIKWGKSSFYSLFSPTICDCYSYNSSLFYSSSSSFCSFSSSEEKSKRWSRWNEKKEQN